MGTQRPKLDNEIKQADDAVIEDAAILEEIERDNRQTPVGDPAQDFSEMAADTRSCSATSRLRVICPPRNRKSCPPSRRWRARRSTSILGACRFASWSEWTSLTS
jgi:hypothetical protein